MLPRCHNIEATRKNIERKLTMKKILLYLFLIFITLLIIINPADSVNYALSGLGLCYEIIIPSLFPFFVCSGLLVYSGFCGTLSRIFRPVMKPVFNVGGAGSAAFVLGIISGYPLGAHTACRLYESSYLSKSETERLLSFCSNSGPLFILGAVGTSMYHSLSAGILIYASHLLSAVSVGLIMRFYKSRSYAPPYTPVKSPDAGVGEIFSKVISDSVNSVLSVSGSVIFCSVISRLFLELIPVHGVLHSLILGAMEFVSGISELSGQSIPTVLKLSLSSWCVGFAGISVHLQVMAVASRLGLSLKPYIVGKLLHGALSAVYTFIGFKIMNPAASTFANGSLGYSFFTSSVFTVMGAAAVVGGCIGASLLLYFKEAKRVKRSFLR